MAQTYGDIFKQAREEAGLSLSDISNQLHVREDILKALEDADFDKIPPQGYARNMVKSYSRILGLDGQQMTNSFLDSEHAYRLNKSRIKQENIINENRRRYERSPEKTGGFMTPRQQISYKRQNATNNTTSATPSTTSRMGRINTSRPNAYVSSLGTRPAPAAYSSFGQARRPSRLNVSSTFTGSGTDPRSRIQQRQQANSSVPQKSGFDESVIQTRQINKRGPIGAMRERRAEYRTDEQELPSSSQVSQSVNFQNMHLYRARSSSFNTANKPNINLFLIGLGVVVLIVVLVLVLFFVGRTSSNSKNDYNSTPITGLNDVEKVTNSNNSDNSTNTDTSTKTIPTEVEFKYSVVSGKQTYMEIYENDSSKPTLARTVTSGQSDTFKVTNKLKVVVVNPANVTLTVDGATITPIDTNKTGVYTYTVDFASWLKD